MRLVLATCRPKPGLTPGDGLLAEALQRRGVTVESAPWDTIDPAVGDQLVCLRSTWDYHLRWGEFRRWVGRFGDGQLWNPAVTVLWNADKIYLRDLAEAGVALPRTCWLAPGERPDLGALLEDWGLEQAVLKPRVSATAYGTHVADRDLAIADEEWRPLEISGCLVQAFVPEIQSRGENSLVFLAGRYSHAVLKRARHGDFRVQTDFGGTLERTQPDDDTVEFGERVLGAAGRPWIYGRVDVVETEAGPVLMELELIEPDLFLTPSAADWMAERLVEAVEEAA